VVIIAQPRPATRILEDLMNKEQNRSLRQLAKFLFPAAALAFVVSFAMRSRLPAPPAILASLRQDPLQTDADVPAPFDVTRKSFTYTVTPLFTYELWGMIVSSHSASSFIDISHAMWNDYINVKDICVLWGRNVETGVYKRMTFRNRDFTCFYSYPDEETGRTFTENCLSNNHLLPADPLVSRAVMAARRGDQIHLKGWLISYGIKDTPYRRMSSTTRTDRGNGACETIFVTDFEILKKANADWRMLNTASLVLMALCAAVLLFA
jgi:hypothetical protein